MSFKNQQCSQKHNLGADAGYDQRTCDRIEPIRGGLFVLEVGHQGGL